MKDKATIYDLHRMCNSMIDCKGCMLHSYNIECSFLEYLSKKEILEINEDIIEWCKTHPPKSYKEDFLEKFPNAEIGDYNTPVVCRKEIYGDCNCNNQKQIFEICAECWNKPMKEEE